jgi:hypothetical protein
LTPNARICSTSTYFESSALPSAGLIGYRKDRLVLFLVAEMDEQVIGCVMCELFVGEYDFLGNDPPSLREGDKTLPDAS